MESLKNVRVTYTHPAVPPANYNVGWIYRIGFDKRGLYLDDGNLEQAITLEKLQILFTPIENTWQELIKEIVIERPIKKK